MSRPTFRDRFLTPPVARAMMAPSSILLTSAAASVGIIAGLPLLAAVGAGAAAWAARVLVAMPDAPDRARIDAGRLQEPWRSEVRDAQGALRRFREAVDTVRSGPLRERLDEIEARLESGVDSAWAVARQGDTLAGARGRIDTETLRHELASVQRLMADQWGKSDTRQATADALQAQLDAAERMERVLGDTRDRLDLLNARLNESVTRAIELAASATDDAQLGGVGTEVSQLVDEMEALRLALGEAGGAAAPPPA